MQGYKTLADEIKTIAKNETMHAKTFFDFILENGAACPNAEVAGGFPFEGDTVENGLIAALNAEKKRKRIYISVVCKRRARRRLYPNCGYLFKSCGS